MTFEERMAELGVDLSDIQRPDIFGLPTMDEVVSAYLDYYVEIMDRMETRIVNLTGERDYLLTQVEEDCMICANAEPEYHRLCAKYDILPDECFEFEGVPEDWRPNDE